MQIYCVYFLFENSFYGGCRYILSASADLLANILSKLKVLLPISKSYFSEPTKDSLSHLNQQICAGQPLWGGMLGSQRRSQNCNTFHSSGPVVPFVWAQFSIHHCRMDVSMKLIVTQWLLEAYRLIGIETPLTAHEVMSVNDMLSFFQKAAVRE